MTKLTPEEARAAWGLAISRMAARGLSSKPEPADAEEWSGDYPITPPATLPHSMRHSAARGVRLFGGGDA